MISFRIIFNALWSSWNIKKAAEIFQKGSVSAEPQKFEFYLYNSRVLSEKNLVTAMSTRRYMTIKAVALAGLIMTGFTAYFRSRTEIDHE